VGGDKPQWAVRHQEWKLIGNLQSALDKNLTADDQRLFLSNLQSDVSEKENMAARHPEVAQQLTQMHDHWLAECKQTVKGSSSSQDKAGNEK
jgi:arylsulfatase A-like enzyme